MMMSTVNAISIMERLKASNCWLHFAARTLCLSLAFSLSVLIFGGGVGESLRGSHAERFSSSVALEKAAKSLWGQFECASSSFACTSSAAILLASRLHTWLGARAPKQRSNSSVDIPKTCLAPSGATSSLARSPALWACWCVGV